MEPTYPHIDDLQTDVDNLRAQLSKWNAGTYDRETPISASRPAMRSTPSTAR